MGESKTGISEPFPKQALVFTCLQFKSFENIARKETLLTRAISPFHSAFYLVKPFPKKPWFLRVCSVSLLKTLREKEKLPV